MFCCRNKAKLCINFLDPQTQPKRQLLSSSAASLTYSFIQSFGQSAIWQFKYFLIASCGTRPGSSKRVSSSSRYPLTWPRNPTAKQNKKLPTLSLPFAGYRSFCFAVIILIYLCFASVSCRKVFPINFQKKHLDKGAEIETAAEGAFGAVFQDRDGSHQML